MTMTVRAVLLFAALTTLDGCGASSVTEDRVERAIASAFANLVPAQLARMHLSDVPPPSLRVVASCYRAAGGREGAGDWVCTIVWSGANGATLRDSYDVTVGANACYTATVGSAEAQLGGPTVADRDGRQVRNLLYAFDGCFDPFQPGR